METYFLKKLVFRIVHIKILEVGRGFLLYYRCCRKKNS